MQQNNMLQQIFDLNAKGFCFTFFQTKGGVLVSYQTESGCKIIFSGKHTEQDVQYAIDACHLFLESLEMEAIDVKH